MKDGKVIILKSDPEWRAVPNTPEGREEVVRLLDGEPPPRPVVRTGPRVGRNGACGCGSGKKRKRCCNA